MPQRGLILGLCGLFLAALIRTAWLCDDAYITFRCVDNLCRGLGLTWNPAERVQVFTNPGWLFVMAAASTATSEIFYTSIFVSIAVSLATFWLLLGRVARTAADAAVLGVLLLCSRAFVDYSTSGLENPLTHLLVALFCGVYLTEPDRPNVGKLALIASLAAVNRADTLLVFAPALGAQFWRWRGRQTLLRLAIGFLPIVAWEVFSVIYYGFPFPNTAYAKLAVSVPWTDVFRQGLWYAVDSLRFDTLTIPTIAAVLSAPLWRRDRRAAPLALGGLLYVLYVLRIGGDFMSGRMWALPFLIAAILAVRCMRPGGYRAVAGAVLAAVLLGGWRLELPLLSSPNLGTAEYPYRAWRGISDERRNYYPSTGLLSATRSVGMPDHDWARWGLEDRERSLPCALRRALGFYGYYAGPTIHVIDVYGLSDPLLARIPAVIDRRVGHLEREVPDGYLRSLQDEEIRLTDPALDEYYADLEVIVRGPLFRAERWGAIWRVNSGANRPLMEAYLASRER